MLCEVFQRTHNNILRTMLLFFSAEPPEGSKLTGIQCWVSDLLLPSQIQLTKLLEYLMTQLFTKWWSSPHLWLWMRKLLLDRFMSLPVYNQPVHLWNVTKKGYFWRGTGFLNFPSLLLPMSQFYWKALQAKKYICPPPTKKNHNIHYCISSVCIQLNINQKSLYSVCIYILHNVSTSHSQLYWNWDLNIHWGAAWRSSG